MKRLIASAACLVAALAFLTSCQESEKVTPDGACELSSFVLTAALNSSLASDIPGTIDASAKTITLVIPTSVTATTFIPTFTATKDDVVSVAGTAIESGVSSVPIADGTKITVSDKISELETVYTIAVQANDEAVELVGVVFKAADNSDLTEDIAPEAIASEMLVRVPGAAFRKELVLTVTAGENDAIKVNNESVESGASIKVDTNFPIDITVSDAIAGKSESYVLKVGKLLEYVVNYLTTYTEGTVMDFSHMSLNPVDNTPYIAYTRKLEGDKNNNISVAKWDGSSFAILGESGIADASRSASKPRLAYAADGSIYILYLGGDVASRPTVKKLDGSWSVVGAAGFTPYNNNTTYNYPFFVHPANSALVYFWCGNSKNQPSYRTTNVAIYSGSDWSSNTVSGSVPAYGAQDGTDGMYYTSAATTVNGKVYMVSSFNRYGYYVHEVASDGTLTSIVSDYKPGTSEYGLPANVQIADNGSDTVYILAADISGNAMQVYTVDIEGKTLKEYGKGIPVTISSSGGISQDVSIGINPVDGLMIAAYDADSDGNPVFAYMNESYEWTTFNVSIDAPADSEEPAKPAAATSSYKIVFDKNGNGFVAYQSKAGIEVYRVGLEEDIIPE